jgi:hypothetical protein
MYKITTDGTIIYPDGSTLEAPYEPLEKYLEYAAWVQAGNEPEVIDANA